MNYKDARHEHESDVSLGRKTLSEDSQDPSAFLQCSCYPRRQDAVTMVVLNQSSGAVPMATAGESRSRFRDSIVLHNQSVDPTVPKRVEGVCGCGHYGLTAQVEGCV